MLRASYEVARLPMAPVAELLTPPALLDHVDDSSIVVHGKSNGLFGKTSMTPADYPDARPIWLQRQVVAELYPVVGSLWGRRFDFALSAEGLDAFGADADGLVHVWMDAVPTQEQLARAGKKPFVVPTLTVVEGD